MLTAETEITQKGLYIVNVQNTWALESHVNSVVMHGDLRSYVCDAETKITLRN